MWLTVFWSEKCFLEIFKKRVLLIIRISYFFLLNSLKLRSSLERNPRYDEVEPSHFNYFIS